MLTKGELIPALQAMPESDDTPVVFAHPSHDYWGTMLAGEIQMVNAGYIKHSEYHNKDQMVHEDDIKTDGFADELLVDDQNKPITKCIVMS